MVDPRLGPISAVLESLARIDEHIVTSGHREILGEAVRSLTILPAVALGSTSDEVQRRKELTRCLEQGGALCLRLVLSARALDVPTASQILTLIDQNPMRGMPPDDWTGKDPLWGRVANVIFHAGELAHVTDDVGADCISSLATLAACVGFLAALEDEEWQI